MYVDLNERFLTDAAEGMDLSGLDDEDIPGASLELLTVHVPEAAALSHDLDFIVRMTMGSRATPGLCAEKKDRDVHVAVVGADELVRAADEGQVFLANAVHGGVLDTGGAVRIAEGIGAARGG